MNHLARLHQPETSRLEIMIGEYIAHHWTPVHVHLLLGQGCHMTTYMNTHS